MSFINNIFKLCICKLIKLIIHAYWCNRIKNIIIGLDGGCFESIQPLLNKNLLPNFKKIIKNGFSSKLEVTIPH